MRTRRRAMAMVVLAASFAAVVPLYPSVSSAAPSGVEPAPVEPAPVEPAPVEPAPVSGARLDPVAPGTERMVVEVDSARAVKRVEAALVADGVGVVGRLRHGMHAVLVDLLPEQVGAVRSLPGVRSVSPTSIVRTAASQTSPPWGLDRIDQTTGTNGSYRYPADAGAGVTVYVIDTGVRATHAEFGGRVTSGWWPTGVPGCWGSSAADANGHGTHVAGTLAGATYGVAKQATIVPVKVLDCNGSSGAGSLELGIDWVLGDHDPGEPAVANLSLTGSYSSALNDLMQAMVDDGITVVVAAGNSARNACLESPASAPAAITVGASDSSDQRASFSNFGSCLDLYAPGVGVLSAGRSSDLAMTTMNGTSMASPHVAGVAALLLGLDGSLTPAQVWNRIRSVAVDNVITQPSGQYVPFVNVPWQLLTVTKPAATTGSGTGSGTVHSADSRIVCGATCSDLYLRGDTVTLTATPAAGSVFQGWTGACSGTAPCTVVMNAARDVGAVFATASLGVTVEGSGFGTVVDDLDLVDCGTTCAAAPPNGTSVTLTATPGPGSEFTGWSGGVCSGLGTCTVVTSGSPITVTATFGAPDTFVALAQPVRLVDTRPGSRFMGVLDGIDAPFASGEVRRYVPVGVAGVPSGSTLALNVTVTGATANGHLQVFPCDSVTEPPPVSSFMNVTVGVTMANSGLVRVPRSGGFCVKSARPTAVIIDATGWFPALDTMHPTTVPLRLVDTRSGQRGLVEAALGIDQSTPIPGNGVRRYVPLGLGDLPQTGVSALAVNVVAIVPPASGVLRVYPCSSVSDPQPTATTVSFQAGVTIANSSTVPLANGGFCVAASTSVHMLVDSPGWFASGEGLSSFSDGRPRLLIDTRSNIAGLLETSSVYNGLLPAGVTRRIALGGIGQIPPAGSLGAVSITLIAVAPTANGHLRVWPCATASTPPPSTSAVNFRTGITIGNAAIVGTSAGGICIDSFAATNVRVDLTGWFPPTA